MILGGVKGYYLANPFGSVLNIALGFCGEFYSCYESCKQAGQIKEDEYDKLDQLHYKV